jgi:hypothetical protein
MSRSSSILTANRPAGKSKFFVTLSGLGGQL